MTEEEKKGYRALYDSTKQMIKRGEDYITALSGTPPGVARDALITSTTKFIEKLETEATELEKRGWN